MYKYETLPSHYPLGTVPRLFLANPSPCSLYTLPQVLSGTACKSWIDSTDERGLVSRIRVDATASAERA